MVVLNPAPVCEPQTVMRLRDAVLVAHRVVRTFSGLRTRGRIGAVLSIAAYPIAWLAYFGLICVQASSTVHSGVASMTAPNPVARPVRPLWSGVALAAAVSIGVGELFAHAPSSLHAVLCGLAVLVIAAWALELAASRHPGGKSGSLRSTEQLVRTMVDGPVVRGDTFAAWPQHSGEFGPLLDGVVAELRRDGVTLVVAADTDALARTYLHHGGVRPDPTRPRHIAWLAA